MPLSEFHRAGNVLSYMTDRKFSSVDIKCIGAMLIGTPRDLIDNLPRSRMATDAYEPPHDEISKQLVGLLDVLKGMLKHSDYSTIESRIGAIMTASRTRVEAHEAELNQLSNSGGKTDGAGPPAKPEPAQDSADVFARRSTGPSIDEILNGPARRAAAEHRRSRDQLQKHLDRIRIL